MMPNRHGRYTPGGWSSQPNRSFPQRQPVREWPAPELGPRIQIFQPTDFDAPAKQYEDSASITGCEAVGSYSWMDSPAPVIMVPGMPPKWTPVPGSHKPPTDNGVYYRDPNARRHPAHPLEPAVLTILETDPEAVANIDIVACSSALGNLLRFIRGSEQPKKFRILVEAVGASVFFTRRENDPKETIEGVIGWGHTFPEANTTWGEEVKGSEDNQRILKYKFGGLNCLVRFKCDGYLPCEGADKEKNGEASSAAGVQSGDVGSITAQLSGTKLTPSTPFAASKVTIQHGGTLVPQSQVFDIKTRSVRKRDEEVLSQELQRLWVAQIPNFILAFHQHGVFWESDRTVRNVRPEIEQWEKTNKPALARLAALLHKVSAMARERDDGKLELCHVPSQTGGGKYVLEIREQLDSAGDVLSVETRGRLAMVREESDEDEVDDAIDEKRWESDGDYDHSKDHYGLGQSYYSDDDFVPDFTACDKECGYCGKCDY